MADDQGDKEVEGQSQPVATPATEQQVPAGSESQGDAPEFGDSVGTEGPDELGLPKDASERTRQRVSELLEENKRLKEAQFQIPDPVYQTPVAPLPAQGVPSKTDEFGNVNPDYLDYLEQRMAAREQAEIQRSVKVEAQEAETAHPEIKTNKALLNMARGVKTDSLVYPESYGGHELSLKEALDFVKKQSGNTVKPTTPEPSQEKIDASVSVEGRPSQGVQRELSDDDYEELRWATADVNHPRHKEAVIARMRSIPKEKG